ncbi:MAG: methyl-accepting chemotaxis protein [Clostridiales bacterium]|nr:methyl-accepting chemotaxis protein [Clostridiales bacterium]
MSLMGKKNETTSVKKEGIAFGLKQKIMFAFIALVALSGILIITVTIQRSTAFLEEQGRMEIDGSLKALEQIIQQEAEGLHGMLEVISSYPGLAKAVADEDREAVAIILQPIFHAVKEATGVTNLQVNDKRLHAFYRAHKPEEFGDDLSSRVILRKVANEKQGVEGFDMGRSGLALRAALPLTDEYGFVMGVIEIGKLLNNDYLDNLSERLGVNLTIFQGDERIATTVLTADGERAVGTKIAHSEILKDVLAGGGRWAGQLVIVGSNNIFGAYSAIRDVEGNITGMLFTGQSAVAYETRKKQDLRLAILLLIISLGITAVLALILSTRIVGPIISLSAVLKKIAAGNFIVEIKDYGKDEIGIIARAVKDMTHDLRELFASVANSSQSVEQLAGGVSGASDNISISIQDVASSVNEVAAATSELSTSAQDMTHESTLVAEKAEYGEKEMNKALEQMKLIEDSFRQLKVNIEQLGQRSASIGEIVKVINDISEQTNLLALNAAIEAARAGEYGRGFAVVADEVRKLAEQSSTSTKEIERLISGTQVDSAEAVKGMEQSSAAVDVGITVMLNSSKTFGEIVLSIKGLLAKIQDVASSSQELSASSQEVAASTEEQSASIEEISAAAEELKQAAKTLSEELNKFNF